MDPRQRVALDAHRRRRVLAGDEDAWQAWYDESFDALYRYALWRCSARRDWAEEVVQETWLIAVRRIRRFDPQQAPFATWLRGIAANVLRNQRRRRQRNPTIEFKDQDSAPVEVPPQASIDAVHKALDRLPGRFETVLRAKYLDEKPVQEIADSYGTTTKAIESLLSRARRAFKAVFRRGEDD